MNVKSLHSRNHPLAVLDEQRRQIEQPQSVPPFEDKLAEIGLSPLTATDIEIFQINVGYMCNQTCKHCHVDAGPDRTEIMTRATMQQCLDALAKTNARVVDITGGAPEMNPDFRWLVTQIRAMGRQVIDRCNLTILTLPSYTGLAEFLAENRVEVVASLPYYLGQQTDAQRGDHVFERSIAGLKMLNALGYGRDGSGLTLNLVYNPVGAYLPPKQKAIEADYKRELLRRYDIVFNQLFTITNIPINRYLDYLIESGNHESYMQRLLAAFNPAAAREVMCRNTISIGWDGRLFDCDFNQMLEMPLADGLPRHIADFEPAAVATRRIQVGKHCYACTAGSGSSCGGSILE